MDKALSITKIAIVSDYFKKKKEGKKLKRTPKRKKKLQKKTSTIPLNYMGSGSRHKVAHGYRRIRNDFGPLPTLGTPHQFENYSKEWDNNMGENLDWCFTHLRALQILPQMTKFVADFCNDILQNMPRNENDDSEAMYKRFLFHYSKAHTPHLKNTITALHPLLHLAPKLMERKMDRKGKIQHFPVKYGKRGLSKCSTEKTACTNRIQQKAS
ncbi:uncharacterized protein [Narcine bancroftii]|uniref:uncharacterized protein isoform X2 n=1 Tax=Narcine bancroftii TaxID=1343680 RepID=UPI0038322118